MNAISQSLGFALYADGYDPLVVLQQTRQSMLKGTQVGPAWELRRKAYRAALQRMRKPVDLPSDTPYDLSAETVAWLRSIAA